jgi:hypothetical protein
MKDVFKILLNMVENYCVEVREFKERDTLLNQQLSLLIRMLSSFKKSIFAQLCLLLSFQLLKKPLRLITASSKD